MDRGVVRQIGTATEVYEYPNSSFVAGFIGSINMYEGEVEAVNGMASVAVPKLGVTVTAPAVSGIALGQTVKVAVRPEKIHITREPPAAGMNAIPGTVDDLGYFGKDSLYRIKLETGTVVAVNNVNSRRAAESERVAQWEDKVWLSFEPSSVILLQE
jgi:putrescine transport system ATP-binding protein